jgi:hypothetical protein
MNTFLQVLDMNLYPLSVRPQCEQSVKIGLNSEIFTSIPDLLIKTKKSTMLVIVEDTNKFVYNSKTKSIFKPEERDRDEFPPFASALGESKGTRYVCMPASKNRSGGSLMKGHKEGENLSIRLTAEIKELWKSK